MGTHFVVARPTCAFPGIKICVCAVMHVVLFNARGRLVVGKRHDLYTMVKRPSEIQEVRKRLEEIDQQLHDSKQQLHACKKALQTLTEQASPRSTISRAASSHSTVNAGRTKTPLQEQLTHTNKQQGMRPGQGHQARKDTTPTKNKAKKTTKTSTTRPTTTTKVISKNHVVYYKHTLCMHEKRRDKCKQCGGVGLCQHFRVRNQCRDCNGSGICIHQRRRSRCQECKQPQISVQQRKTSQPMAKIRQCAAEQDDSMPVDLEEIEPDCI